MKHHHKDRRAQYFMLDAFVALTMLAVGLIVIFSLRSETTYLKQPIILSQDIANSLDQLKVTDINSAFMRNLTQNGTVTNLDNTLFQQIAEFYIIGQKGIARDMTQNLSDELIPRQYNFEVRIDGELIYRRGVRENQSSLLVSSRKILFGVINKTVQPWGPMIGEATIWE